MSKMCWEVKPDCMALKESPQKQSCPAYEQKIGCWDLDVRPLLEQTTKEQQKMMVEYMKEGCPKCPVYTEHQEAIDKKIRLICKSL